MLAAIRGASRRQFCCSCRPGSPVGSAVCPSGEPSPIRFDRTDLLVTIILALRAVKATKVEAGSPPKRTSLGNEGRGLLLLERSSADRSDAVRETFRYVLIAVGREGEDARPKYLNNFANFLRST